MSIHSIIAELRDRVVATRRRLRRNAVLTGVALLEIVAVAWLIVAALADVAFVLPVALRVVAWGGLWMLVAVIAAAWVIWPAVRPMPIQRVAFAIEKALGKMHNRLVTSLDLQRGNGSADVEARPFVGRLVDQTAQRMRDYRVEQVADPVPLRRMLIAGVIVLAAALGLVMLLGDRMPTALARIVMPTRPIPPATGVVIEPDPGDVDVLYGDAVTIRASITKGEVDRLDLRLRDGEGDTTTYPMQMGDDGSFTYTLGSVDRSYDYQLLGGRTWTLPNHITMVRRPLIEDIDTAVRLPEYMALLEPGPVEDGATRIAAPRGSTVQLTVQLSGDVTTGHIDLLHESTRLVEREVEQENVWFEDDLPKGSDLTGTWRWTTTDVHSGRRAHTFDWRGTPYGFVTRVDAMTVDRHGPMFVYVYLDPDDTPKQLRIEVDADRAGRHTLVWGEAPSDGKKGNVHYLGALPDAGVWQRLEITTRQLLGRSVNHPVTVRGLTFAIDSGSARFDRAGTIERRTERVTETHRESIATLDMQREEQSGRWVGRIPVEVDGAFTMTFANRLGHESPEMQPIAIVATTDEGPSLLVEKPVRDLTLEQAAAVPLVVRAFDDYGLREVRLEWGAEASELNVAQPFAEYDQPKTSAVAMGVLDPQRWSMTPGQSRYYRAVAVDRAGQIAVSRTFRFTLAKAAQVADGRDPAKAEPGPLEKLLEALGELIDVQADAAEALADAAKEKAEAEDEPLDPEEAKRLAELAEKLDAQAEALAEQLEQAAAGAEDSPTALPHEADALDRMARQARQQAQQTQAMDAQEAQAASAEQLERQAQTAAEQREQTEQMQADLEQVERAHQELAENPAAAQQRMAALQTQMQTRQAMAQLQQLDQQLEGQQGELQQMQRRAQEMAEQVRRAPGEELGELSRQTRQEIDPPALALLEETDQALAARRAQQAARDGEATEGERAERPEPWTPTQAEAEAQAGEQEQGEAQQGEAGEQQAGEHQAGQRQGEAAEQQAQREAELEAPENAPWWDQAPGEEAGEQGEQGEQQAGEQAQGEQPQGEQKQGEQAQGEQAQGHQAQGQQPQGQQPSGQGEPQQGQPQDGQPQQGPATPRQQLAEHNEQLARALGENAAELAHAEAEAQELAEQMAAALAEAGQPMTPGEAMALQQMMQSPTMQQAMAMAAANAMQAQQQADGQQPPQNAQAQGQAQQSQESQPADPDGSHLRPADKYVLVNVEGLSAEQAAALYRLPPTLRQPLLQSMSEQGPAAYQDLINAYYRELSRQVEDKDE